MSLLSWPAIFLSRTYFGVMPAVSIFTWEKDRKPAQFVVTWRDAVEQVDIHEPEIAEHGLDREVGVDGIIAGIVVGVAGLGLPAVLGELRRGEIAGKLVVGPVHGDPEGNIQRVAEGIAEICPRAAGSELGAIAICVRVKILSVDGVVEFAGRSQRRRSFICWCCNSRR